MSNGDYNFEDLQVSLSATNTTVCFPAGVVEDSLVEDTESYTLALNSSDNVVFMGRQTIVRIADNGECSYS